jgi:hypothetical protein
MLCSHYGMLDWCGLVDLRRAPIATEFCVAEKYREVPTAASQLLRKDVGEGGSLKARDPTWTAQQVFDHSRRNA